MKHPTLREFVDRALQVDYNVSDIVQIDGFEFVASVKIDVVNDRWLCISKSVRIAFQKMNKKQIDNIVNEIWKCKNETTIIALVWP